MSFNFPPFTIAFWVAAALTLVFAHIVWTRRPAPGAAPFAVLSLAVAEWELARSFEAGGADFAIKVFWGKAEFFGILAVGILWLMFAMEYTGSRWSRRPGNILMLLVIPLISLVMIWTNQWHGLFWTNIYPSPGTGGTILVWEHGTAFWIEAAYTYALIIIGIILLWRFALGRHGLFRWQVNAILLGTLIPLIGNAIYLQGYSPVKGLDLTPFAFTVSGLIYAVTIFRFRFMDVVPVARSALVESMPDGILVLNNNGLVIDMNPAAERIMGATMLSAMWKPVEQVWLPWKGLDKSVVEGGCTELVSGEAGYRRYLDLSVTPIKDRNAALVGRLVVIRDISERRKMEQVLRESEARYSTLVEQLNEGVLIMQDGIYKFANRTIAEISGYSVTEIIGKSLPYCVAEEDWDLIKERYRARLAGEPVPNIYEVRLKCKDGRKIEAEVSIGSITYQGRPAHMVTIRDITERKLTQRKLEALYNEEYLLRNSLQEEINKRSRYTGALAHELKTPLTAIIVSSELLEQEIHDSIQSVLIRNIRRASLNLEQRINELVELARGEIGLLRVDLQPLDISELVNEITAEMLPIASRQGLSLVSEIHEGLPQAYGDKSRLRQVLANLLSNAFRYTSQGKVIIRVSLQDSGSLLVQVEDTGRGIDEKQMENLFDPYQRRANDNESLGGLGIGLALSKLYIELHQGKIWAVSSPGKGTTLNFTVPVFKDGKEAAL